MPDKNLGIGQRVLSHPACADRGGRDALMRPSKSTMDMEIKSLKKKYKDKKFAAGCSREIISQRVEMLGWELDDLFDKTIQAMRSCEADVAAAMEKEV